MSALARAPNGNLLKASRTLYDASTSAVPGPAGYTAPTKGNTARGDKATAVSGTSVTTWAKGPTVTFDALGRAIKSSDTSTGTARDTTTTYAPATGLATTVTQTNPMGVGFHDHARFDAWAAADPDRRQRQDHVLPL